MKFEVFTHTNKFKYRLVSKKMIHLLFLLQILFLNDLFPQAGNAPPQKMKVDSLEKVLATAKEDTMKVFILNSLAIEYKIKDPEKGLRTARQALSLAEKLDYPVGKMAAYNLVGLGLKNKNEFDSAMIYFKKGLEIGEKYGFKYLSAKVSLNIGVVYMKLGNYPKCVDNYLKALNFFDKLNDKKGLAVSESNLGIVYSRMEKSETAIMHYKKALVYRAQVNDQYGIANDLGNLAIEYSFAAQASKKKNDYDTALYYYDRSLNMLEGFGDKQGMAQTIDNMSAILIDQAVLSGSKTDFDKAENLINKALAINVEIDDQSGIAACYSNLGALFGKQKQVEKAITFYKKALDISLKIKETEWIRDNYYGLSNAYEDKKDFEDALENFKQYTNYKDSLLDESSSKQITEMESKYGAERKQHEIESIQQKNELDSSKQREIRNAVIAGLIVVLLLLVVIYNRYRVKKKANDQLSEQNAIIEEKNENLQMANSIIEEKNKNITDSINYAKRIQEAILPPKELKYKLFPDAFVLFQPRDIVSGDFYWFAEKDGKKLIAAVDCTGHGVPGAFMSMIGNAFLNEIVIEKGIIIPSKILDALREMIITSLKQNDTANKDGMDMTVCCFDEKNNSVEFAGANNPLWKFSGSNNELKFEEIKGDKQPIGVYEGAPVPFTNHIVPLSKGDSIYIFTDGYADQFGGDKGKKFKYKNLQKLISSVQHQAMKDQENTLQIQLDDWKGNLEQVDDVLIIGVRV